MNKEKRKNKVKIYYVSQGTINKIMKKVEKQRDPRDVNFKRMSGVYSVPTL